MSINQLAEIAIFGNQYSVRVHGPLQHLFVRAALRNFRNRHDVMAGVAQRSYHRTSAAFVSEKVHELTASL